MVMPSPGVILEHRDLYKSHEKKNKKEQKKDEHSKAKDTSSSYFAVLGSLTSLVQKTGDAAHQAIDHLTGADAKLEMLDAYLTDKLEPKHKPEQKSPPNPPDKWTPMEWVEFMIELRHKGSIAQSAKITSGQSRLLENFFGYADYVQYCVTYTEDEFRKAYSIKVQELRKNIQDTKNKIKLDKKNNKGEHFFEYNMELNNYYLDLAFCGDPKGIEKALLRPEIILDEKKNEYKLTGKLLLSHLLSVSAKEEYLSTQSVCRNSRYFDNATPYVLQPGFFGFCFADRDFASYAKRDCSTFIKEATSRYAADQLQKQKDAAAQEIEEKRKQKAQELATVPLFDEPPPVIAEMEKETTTEVVVPPYVVPEEDKKQEENKKQEEEGSDKNLDALTENREEKDKDKNPVSGNGSSFYHKKKGGNGNGVEPPPKPTSKPMGLGKSSN